uniref:Chloroplast protein-transporting ATPase n=1 Tax=Panagrolaimus sp. PS1159 TaxID=55785 RepID=A0AC35G6C2_9BILA
MIFQTRGFLLRDNQKLAVLCALKSKESILQQIATGEGKSLIIAAISIISALKGHTVNIVTSSSTLAKRDVESPAPKGCTDLYAAFGISADHICVEDSGLRQSIYASSNIIYGDLTSFQRDYLLDTFYGMNIVGGRKFDVILVDEVDSMVLDQGSNMLYLSHEIPDFELLQPLFVRIWQIIDAAVFSQGNIEFATDSVYRKVYDTMFYAIDLTQLEGLFGCTDFEAKNLRTDLLRDKIVELDEYMEKKWSKKMIWKLVGVFAAAVGQLIVGGAIAMFTAGAGVFASKFLISEGISDLIFVIKGACTGYAGSYWEHKKASMMSSVLMCGVGALISYGSHFNSIAHSLVGPGAHTANAQVMSLAGKAMFSQCGGVMKVIWATIKEVGKQIITALANLAVFTVIQQALQGLIKTAIAKARQYIMNFLTSMGTARLKETLLKVIKELGVSAGSQLARQLTQMIESMISKLSGIHDQIEVVINAEFKAKQIISKKFANSNSKATKKIPSEVEAEKACQKLLDQWQSQLAQEVDTAIEQRITTPLLSMLASKVEGYIESAVKATYEKVMEWKDESKLDAYKKEYEAEKGKQGENEKAAWEHYEKKLNALMETTRSPNVMKEIIANCSKIDQTCASAAGAIIANIIHGPVKMIIKDENGNYFEKITGSPPEAAQTIFWHSIAVQQKHIGGAIKEIDVTTPEKLDAAKLVTTVPEKLIGVKPGEVHSEKGGTKGRKPHISEDGNIVEYETTKDHLRKGSRADGPKEAGKQRAHYISKELYGSGDQSNWRHGNPSVNMGQNRVHDQIHIKELQGDAVQSFTRLTHDYTKKVDTVQTDLYKIINGSPELYETILSEQPHETYEGQTRDVQIFKYHKLFFTDVDKIVLKLNIQTLNSF